MSITVATPLSEEKANTATLEVEESHEVSRQHIISRIKNVFLLNTNEIKLLLEEIEQYAYKYISRTNINQYNSISYYVEKKLIRLNETTKTDIAIKLSQEKLIDSLQPWDNTI